MRPPWRDPLPLLTVLGLLGCALLATLHPAEVFDPARAEQQAGRNVQVRLDVLSATTGDGWASGVGSPAQHTDAGPPPLVEWVWFRPPSEPPLVGDRLEGRALVQRDAGGTGLVFDGAGAATVSPGPHPVRVRWGELIEHPERFSGRPLLVVAAISGGALIGPDGETCLLARPADDAAQTLLRTWLIRTTNGPGWLCALEAPA